MLRRVKVSGSPALTKFTCNDFLSEELEPCNFFSLTLQSAGAPDFIEYDEAFSHLARRANTAIVTCRQS